MQITARVDAETVTNEWANSGVMIRTSLAPNSAFAYSASTAQHGLWFRQRPSNGVAATSTASTQAAPPVWVRLVRQGSVVTSYGSVNGTTWTQIAIGDPQFGIVGLCRAGRDQS